ncbi:MAG: peptide ABC transporter substrate-binding protein [Planctomycetota bacterium]
MSGKSKSVLAGTAVALLALGVLGPPGRTVPSGTVVVGLGGDPSTLDPGRVTSVRDGRLVRALFEGLTVADEETLAPLPGCAATWSVSPDQRVWSFELVEGLRWSNGDLLVAEDFRRSWLRLLDPREGCPYAHLLWCIEGARAYSEGRGDREAVGIATPTPTRLVVRLETPLPHFLALTSSFPLVPVHGPSVEASAGSALTAPSRLVSNGPYRLVERSLRERVAVERNPHSHRAAEVAVPRIEYLATESATTTLNLFLSGEVHWATAVPTTILTRLVEDPRLADACTPRPHLESAFYRVNVTRPPFDDPRVRRALSLAIDRRVLCQEITRCGEQPAATFVPWPAPALAVLAPGATPPFPEYDRSVAPASGGARHASEVAPEDWGGLLHDPERARALLAEAGFRVPGRREGAEFPGFEIHYSASPLHQRVAEWLQERWREELGLEVRLRRSEGKSAIAEQRRLDYDVSRSSWVADYLDPMTFLEIFHSSAGPNRTGWADAEYDRCIEEAGRKPGGEERNRLLAAAERILLERGPIIPLWYGVTTTFVSPRLEGLGANALDQQWPARFRWTEERP